MYGSAIFPGRLKWSVPEMKFQPRTAELLIDLQGIFNFSSERECIVEAVQFACMARDRVLHENEHLRL